MSKIQIIDLNVNSEDLRDLSDEELNLQGGVLCFLVLAFAAGYGLGCCIR
ncbi:hypothetical protein [Chamaesiphon sp. OTE_75_metabat_556]|nr:hypothetical protein [Chamaesiphon sp. OTE_75_metabat_556]